MTKKEFLKELESRLAVLTKEDRNDRLSFYSEMIDDRVAEGKTEEEAIIDLGGIEKVVSDIASDTPLMSLFKEKAKPKRTLKWWEIMLIIIGFPLWFPLVLVFSLLCLLLYLLIWIGVIIVYAVEVGFIFSSGGSLVIFFGYAFNGVFSLTYLGGFFMFLGVAFLFIFICIGITKATIKLSKVTIRNIKRSMFKKGETK